MAQFDHAGRPPSDTGLSYVHTAKGLGIDLDGRITLDGVSASTYWFTDRPTRLSGAIATADFVAGWEQGPNDFGENPPNAYLSIIEDGAINPVVVVLSDPRLDGDALSYAIDLGDGHLSPSDGPISVVIH